MDGPDRITRITYDNADRQTVVTSAYGTAAQRDDAVYTYSANGRVATAADGKGNLTTYQYDAFDRPHLLLLLGRGAPHDVGGVVVDEVVQGEAAIDEVLDDL